MGGVRARDGYEMDDELTGEPSEAGVDDEHVGQHLRRVASRWNPSVISAHSLPPLLASGALSIGFRMWLSVVYV